ncbi:MAG: ATP-binding protein [Eubacterium sp.]|nr:ATP-binding protein [Eubacterium sp.]
MEQIEIYYEIHRAVYNSCTTLLVACCFVMWIKPFMAEHVKVWHVGAVYAMVMFAGDFLPVYFEPMVVYGVAMFAAFLAMRRRDGEYVSQKLFLAVTFFCIRWQAWRVVSFIGNERLLLEVYLFPAKDERFWFGLTVVDSLIDGLLGFLLMYGEVRCLLWSYGCRKERMSGKEFLLLLTPSASSVFFYGMFRYYNYVYERDAGKSPFDLYGAYDLFMLVSAVFSFVTIFVMTYVYRQWMNEQEEDKRKEVYARQVQDLENHIAEVERLYRNMRRLRHDMGNCLMTLEQLYARGEYEEAERYADALKREIEENSSDVASGNPVTDVILSGKKREMEEKDIAFTCDFHYPKSGTVNAFDVSIILNNALDNAMEAVEVERTAGDFVDIAKNDSYVIKSDGADSQAGRMGSVPHIALSSCLMKNMYIIEVTNSYAGELMIDASSGLPISSKAGDGHGFGLANIRHTARKYYGDIEFGKEVCEGEERFVLRVMMQLVQN